MRIRKLLRLSQVSKSRTVAIGTGPLRSLIRTTIALRPSSLVIWGGGSHWIVAGDRGRKCSSKFSSFVMARPLFTEDCREPTPLDCLSLSELLADHVELSAHQLLAAAAAEIDVQIARSRYLTGYQRELRFLDEATTANEFGRNVFQLTTFQINCRIESHHSLVVELSGKGLKNGLESGVSVQRRLTHNGRKQVARADTISALTPTKSGCCSSCISSLPSGRPLPEPSRRRIECFSCGGFVALRYPVDRDSHTGGGAHL